MSVLDGSEVKRLNCGNVMPLNIAGDVMEFDVAAHEAMQLNITSDVMELDVTAQDAMPLNIQGDVMQFALCWPDIEVQPVLLNGVPLTHNGAPVYVLVRD